jgi:hypothetical protein
MPSYCHLVASHTVPARLGLLPYLAAVVVVTYAAAMSSSVDDGALVSIRERCVRYKLAPSGTNTTEGSYPLHGAKGSTWLMSVMMTLTTVYIIL